MRSKIAALVAALMLSGCNTFIQKAGTADAIAICSATDVVTTGIALHAGAVEANPIVAFIMKPLGIFGYAGLSALLVWYIYEHEQEISKTELAVATSIRCGAAISNGTL